MSSPCWLRHGGPGRTQSGCARARSESGLTISGSTHRPNSMPSPRTWSTSGCSPSGQTSSSTYQSPRPGGVVAPVAEPAVVEHEPLDAQLGRGVGQRLQAVEPVVEVDRLPRVEHDRPRPARVARARADEAVQARAQPVEPFVRPRRVDPRRRVLLAGLQHHLAELRRAEHRRAVGQPLGPPRRVAAPGQVDAPHLAAAGTRSPPCPPRAAAARHAPSARAASAAARSPGRTAAAADAARGTSAR